MWVTTYTQPSPPHSPDGLERLAVIIVGMDVHRDSADPELSDTTRSLIYRGLSRAQMVVHVVNEQVDDGFLTFTNNTKLEENVQFDQEEELKKREAVQREGAMTQLGEALKKHPKRITELIEAVRRARVAGLDEIQVECDTLAQVEAATATPTGPTLATAFIRQA